MNINLAKAFFNAAKVIIIKRPTTYNLILAPSQSRYLFSS